MARRDPTPRLGGVAVVWTLIAVAGAVGPSGRSAGDETATSGDTPPVANAEVARVVEAFEGVGALADGSAPTPAAAAVTRFETPPGLTVELVAAEPDVVQPLYLSFDHRGRMWVVQYKQYPFPAGLKVVRYDQYLRAVFDKVPPPPPHHFVGKDTITVFEDTDGDGTYDRHKDVLTGLNVATAVLAEPGGLWVLNPPYLLRYPDADGDDVPDGDPEVHLSGFGLEDTHSVANSLAFGPDGWIYGANGSTTTATINSAATKNVHFKGQCIWRYHPASKVFEIYAEGGGNTFSVEIDAVGRVFSGTNAGRTRGMFYPQGSYGTKNWGKHGPLTNPHAFGYFEHMRHEGDDDRFAQAFAIYDGGALPDEYRGTIVAANALHNKVWSSDLIRDTSTYRTVDRGTLATTSDRWFRPVDVKVGPDGLVYLADWYDSRLTHVDPRDNWHKSSGRIYRLRPTELPPTATQLRDRLSEDLSELSDDALLERLASPNKWVRQTAVRILGGGADAATTGRLVAIATDGQDRRALEALWAVHLRGAFDEPLARRLFAHPGEHVRRWAIRLLGDRRGALAPDTADALVSLARSESEAQVRSQLASSAKRWDAGTALPIVRALFGRSEDIDDLHIPLLLWWTIEAHAETGRDAVIDLFEEPAVWSLPLVEREILGRLMRRYAAAGSPADLEACTTLLARAPTPGHVARLMAGLEEAFEGVDVPPLPAELAAAIDAHQASLGADGLALDVRRGKAEAVAEALRLVGDATAGTARRSELVRVLGETKQARAIPALARLVGQAGSPALQRVAMQALMNFDDPAIGTTILLAYQSSLSDEHGLRGTAQQVLASRAAWAKQLVAEVDAYRIKPQAIALDTVRQMALHGDPELDAAIARLFGQTRTTPAEKREQIARLKATLAAGPPGRPDEGHKLFTARCGTCHTLFGEGGQVGPDLTGYERENVDFMTLAIVDPSAAIREEFTSFQVATLDGRVLVGLLTDTNERTVTIRDAKGQATTIRRDDLEVLRAVPTSLMPDGLLDEADDQQRRDLFAYLMSRAPQAVPTD